jgi:hypothetical protein
MAGRGRPRGVVLSQEHRGKIKSVAILNALQEHVLGTRAMQQTQVTAAVALLRKVLPDLSQTSVTGDPNNPIEHRVIITGVRRASDLEPPRPLTLELKTNSNELNDH